MNKFLLVCGSLMLYVLLFTGCTATNVDNKVQESKKQDIETSVNKDASAVESIPITDSSKTIISPKPPEKNCFLQMNLTSLLLIDTIYF